ncbi:hypothetical protein CBS101457_000985 [Exobasidium rhododendri]|nr:hypothetical protein CBS101457_000985 [Exobasidium rhododendri]
MITVATDEDTFSIDGDLDMTLENLMAILEADSAIPADSQLLYCNGKLLAGTTTTLTNLGVKDDDLLLLQRKDVAAGSSSSIGGSAVSSSSQTSSDGAVGEIERLRQEMMRNPQMMAQLRATRPDLAEAITSRPQDFLQMMRAEKERNTAAQRAQAELAGADEFDIEAQRRIEEAIRQEAVMENFGSAMEFNPESFGRVTMLYVETQVNGLPVKAFVDSGAQATIMSPECAERCGIMRLIDTRFAGIARGVGTAKILGRVHSAQIKLGDELYLPCSFTIMEGRTTELLFGLDMLKRHACVLDMAKNCLVVHGKSIRFLDEHELPAFARMDGEEEEEEGQGSGATSLGIDAANANAAARAGAGQSFPGSGNTLSNSPPEAASSGSGKNTAPDANFTGMSWNHPPNTSSKAPSPTTSKQSNAVKAWPPASTQALIDLGANEVQAKALLDAADGNIEVAASLLFQQ